MIERLEEIAKSFISEENGNISVDWKSLFKVSMDVMREWKNSYYRRNDELMDYIFEYLQEKKILVPIGTPESYIATGPGIILMQPVKYPMGSRQVLSFSDEKMAREYYSVFCKYDPFDVTLYKTVGPIEKTR